MFFYDFISLSNRILAGEHLDIEIIDIYIFVLIKI